MENTAATPIHLLRPYTKVLKIKVRVCRIWRPRFPRSVEKYSGLRCILVDEIQHAVEVCTVDIDYDIIASKTEAGGCYEIMDFRVNKMRVVFTGKTTFKKLTSVFLPIPRHQFYLQDYNSLYPRLNRVDILTDIMGRITAVQHLEQKQINQRIEPKCDIIIQNIRREELRVTLWANVAESFSSLSAEAFNPPIMIVLTSLKVKYKVNLVLEEETNETNALIIGKSGENLFGSSCKDLVMNQRLVDQQQLPNEFSRLIGQKNFFHLRFGTRKNNLNMNDLLISNVSEDTTVQPTTPQALLTEITVSSTTVSSSTSTPETTAQSHKRKRESVRRSLFTSSEQSDVEENLEENPTDIDEVPIKLLRKKSSLICTTTDPLALKKD
ncbi:unnamed protein product [Malus baccata var. baccata]